MNPIHALRSLFRRKPVTEEDVRAWAEEKQLESQIVDDRWSQRSPAGQIYRSERR